jgi:hypothetical protein
MENARRQGGDFGALYGDIHPPADILRRVDNFAAFYQQVVHGSTSVY